MEHGQKEDAFHGQREVSAGQQPLDDLRDVQFLPQPPEDQRRADRAGVDRGRLALAVRGQDQHGFGEFAAGL